jgi:hypothetical protein
LTSTSALLLATGSPLRRAAMANSGSGSFQDPYAQAACGC